VSDDRATEAKLTASHPAIQRPRYALFVVSERGTGALLPLPESGDVTIGRSDTCSLRLDDARLSRVHAIVRPTGIGYAVVDQGSLNGTWVGDEKLVPDIARELTIGDVIRMGSTDLVLQYAPGGARPRRIWPHGYFEGRLEDECARAEQEGRSFAIARVRVNAEVEQAAIETSLAEGLRARDVLATYAEHDYELLLIDRTRDEARAVCDKLALRLSGEGMTADISLACYPHDGRTPEALVGRVAPHTHPSQAEVASDVIRAGALARMDPLIAKVAAANISVLILGETGVGKEILARMIHERSPRAKNRLLSLNCASLAESLLESELFGHEKGAFTGATSAKVGLLESANGGTAFLDEIGEMPLSLQAKLLRVLEQREVLRIGALEPRPIDVRFLAATNRDLEDEIARDRFRRDLYYRLNGFSIVIPPLRQRVDEIEPLARHFIRLACAETKRRPLELTQESLDILMAYEWPGNIRELRNVIDRAVLLCSGRSILPDHLPREKMGRLVARKDESPASRRFIERAAAVTSEVEVTVSRRGDLAVPPPEPTSPTLPPENGERARIVAALEKCGWNQTRAAKLLGIARQTLVTRIELYGLPRPKKVV
jgi:DNA-binding NtrC family response regulator